MTYIFGFEFNGIGYVMTYIFGFVLHFILSLLLQLKACILSLKSLHSTEYNRLNNHLKIDKFIALIKLKPCPLKYTNHNDQTHKT